MRISDWSSDVCSSDLMERTPELRNLKPHVRFTETKEGLRIDLVEEADFSRFALGTDRLLPAAARLIGTVAEVIEGVPNEIMVRGHTDSLPYAAGRVMNNWMLSTARAEATRAQLGAAGVAPERFARIEGVADREPYVPADRYDPRNRRISITLAWRDGRSEEHTSELQSLMRNSYDDLCLKKKTQ